MMNVAKVIELRISREARSVTASGVLAQGRLELGVLAQTPENIFDVDDGVVDQRADRDGHAAQSHRVDRRAEKFERQHRGEQRERDRQQRNERGAQIHEKQKQDHNHHDGAVAQRVDDVIDGDLDEIRLAKDLPVDRHARRQRLLNVFQSSVQFRR